MATGGKHTCECEAVWIGAATCDRPTGCDSSPCKNGATCHAHGGLHTCECAAGWSGDACDHPTGCDSSPCLNGGTCMATGGRHTCTCRGEWGGDQNCSEPPCINHNDCGPHGHCVDEGDGHSCKCLNGFVGQRCNAAPCIAVNFTPPNGPGKNGPGSCQYLLTSGASCKPTCAENGVSPTGTYLHGVHRCDNGTLSKASCRLCTEEKCAHRGACLPSTGGNVDYECRCMANSGWSGEHCSVKDPCVIDRPCQNGGQCNASNNKAGYDCECPEGFAGVNCATLVTVWHTICCVLDCSASIESHGSMLHVWDAPQTKHLCKVFSWWKTACSILVAACSVTAYVLVYLRLDNEFVSGAWATVALIIAVALAAIGLSGFLYSEGMDNKANLGVFSVLGLALVTLLVQLGIAAIWQDQRRRCIHIESTVTNRLRRGVGVPLVAVASAAITVAVGFTHSHYGFTNQEEIFSYRAWRILSFSVLLPMLPLTIAVGRVYLLRGLPRKSLLEHQEIYRAKVYSFAIEGYTLLAGPLFPLFWIPYMANELQIFSSGICDSTQAISVVGVRALGPLVVTLNGFTIAGLGWAIVTFPAPQGYSPFVFVGLGFAIVAVVLLSIVTLALVWSLAEPRTEAMLRKRAATVQMRTNMLRTSFVQAMSKTRTTCCASLIMFVTSWQGQTAMSTVNHLGSAVVFAYGIANFPQLESNRELLMWITAGMVMSVVGLLISTVSLAERKWPQFKITPTDDSFRLACILKVALVITKAMVVFLVAGLEQKSAEFKKWETVLSGICFVSLAIIALMTCAFTVHKVWGRSEILERIGIEHPKAFIIQYAIGYLCCKFATLFFMAQGHLPGYLGCDQTPVSFDGTMEFGLSTTNASCVLCFPPDDADNSSAVPVDCRADTVKLYYACTTSCMKLFYMGNEHSRSLQEFVLLPLLWLPFAVYSNNEVAQLIDGLWWEHESGQTFGGKVKIGLSSSADGFNTVAPLVVAVTVGCEATLAFFLSMEGGYQVRVLPALLETAEGPGIQSALDKSSKAATIGAIVLNLTMGAGLLTQGVRSYCSTTKGPRKSQPGVEMLIKPGVLDCNSLDAPARRIVVRGDASTVHTGLKTESSRERPTTDPPATNTIAKTDSTVGLGVERAGTPEPVALFAARSRPASPAHNGME